MNEIDVTEEHDKGIEAGKIYVNLNTDTNGAEVKLDKIEQQIDRIRNKYIELTEIIK